VPKSILSWTRPSPMLSYGIALLSVATAVIAALLLDTFLQSSPFVSLFLCAIMFAGWFGGFGPGLLATALSVLAFDYYLLPPVNSFVVLSREMPRVVLFAIAALFVVALSATQRRTAESLRRARDDLANKVQELERLNETLHIESAERKLAEEKIRKAEREHRLTLDSIPTLAWRTRTDGFAEYLNKRWLDYTGLSLEQALGWEWQVAIHPEDLAGLVKSWREMLTSEKAVEVEARMRRFDGAYRWFLFRPEPLRDESGNVVRWYGTNTDIEDLKRAEGALRRSETYLEEAQRLSQTGSFGWKTASGDVVWSKETYLIMGVSQTVQPTIDIIVERTHPDDRARVQQEFDRAAHGGHEYDYEHRLLMPNGDIKHLHVRAHRVSYASGEQEIVGALVDVTAARKAQEALHAAQAELAHASRVATLGELTASIAHEVNQPLAAVISNAAACLRWLDRGAPDLEEARRSVEWIIKDGNRASEVIQRVRALLNKVDTQKVLLDINGVVNEVVVLVQRELLSHRVSLRMELEPALPEVLADRVQLQQVVINLVMNSIEAMQPVADGPRELLIRSHRDEAQQVLVAVKDSGVGVSSENADRLFDAFFTTKSSGMGMGLSICRSIIEAHGGRLSAVDDDGPGATFQFVLPAHRQAASQNMNRGAGNAG
jgi:PAS domain S-box-containing protein